MNNSGRINRLIIKKLIFIMPILSLLLIVSLNSYGKPDISSCPIADVPAGANNTRKVEIRADGTNMVDGKPFFPFGFYHVSWASTADNRINHLRDIAAEGFNTIHASFRKDDKFDDYEKFLDEAEKLGINVLTEFELVPTVDPIEVVKKFKDKPVILGWSIADDVDSYKDGFTPKQILDLHCKFKKADPHHITYISGSKDKRISQFINAADAIGVQAYPVGEKLPLNWVKHMISIARGVAPKNRLIIGNVQAFSWYYKGAPVPTFEQVRNMTYQTLMAGAKGILYYTYYDDGWSLEKHPDLWDRLKSLVPEINQISPILLEGDLREIDVGLENVYAGIWVSKDQALAVIVNTSDTNNAEVAIALPAGVSEARPMFQGRPSGMSVKEGKLSGSLNPLEVDVYSLKA